MSGYLARRLPYLATLGAVIAADQLSKSLVDSRLAPLGSIQIIPGLFDLTYVRNPGGVFGLLRNLDGGIRSLLFTAVPAAAVLLIAAYAIRIPVGRRLALSSLSLILGGAVGNLLDRFRYGHVIDFLDFYWRQYHWPAFNVADSAICVGVALLIGETLFGGESPSGEVAP